MTEIAAPVLHLGELIAATEVEAPAGTFDTLSTEAWINATLSGDWTTAAGREIGYKKGADGLVQLRGRFTTGTAGTVAFTLPAGYRPTTTNGRWVGMKESDGVAASILITLSGAVIPAVAGSTNLHLNGISFYAG